LIQGCRFEEAALSLGNLSEVERRILSVLLPVEREQARSGTAARRQPQRHQRPFSAIVSARATATLSQTPLALHRRSAGRSTSSWRSRGGFTSKVHCLGDARGRPIAFHLTPGDAADCKSYDTLIDLPEQAPDALLADNAYDTDAIRADSTKRGIKPVIPPKSNRKATIRYSKRLYRERNCIERVLGHLKINRAIATKYDQLVETFLGMLFLASARYWIKFVQRQHPTCTSSKMSRGTA
jgi:transposase